jgi:hypothetical protein
VQYDIVQMDETRVQVREEANRLARSQCWMWVIRGSPQGRPIIRFDYDPSRAGAVPTRLLEGYQGYLKADGYKADGQVLSTPGIKGLGCRAHALRTLKRGRGHLQEWILLNFPTTVRRIEVDSYDLKPGIAKFSKDEAPK